MTELLDFLRHSPSPYHAAESAAGLLAEAGFRRQTIGEPVDGSPGGAYVVRGARSWPGSSPTTRAPASS